MRPGRPGGGGTEPAAAARWAGTSAPLAQAWPRFPQQYPEGIRRYDYNPSFAIRGLHYDIQKVGGAPGGCGAHLLAVAGSFSYSFGLKAVLPLGECGVPLLPPSWGVGARRGWLRADGGLSPHRPSCSCGAPRAF